MSAPNTLSCFVINQNPKKRSNLWFAELIYLGDEGPPEDAPDIAFSIKSNVPAYGKTDFFLITLHLHLTFNS